MGQVGFQDVWITGSRFYFQKDAVAGVEQPLVDLGVIQVANPTIEPELAELYDSDGGLQSLFDEKVTRVNESFELVTSNLSLTNLALLWMSDDAEAFTQAAADSKIAHYAHPGAAIKIKDAAGDWVYNLTAIAGVYDGTPTTVSTLTDIDAATRTLTFSTDPSLSPSDVIIVCGDGLSDLDNAGTYTVVSSTGAGPTDIVVEEALSSSEATLTGTSVVTATAGGSIYDPNAATPDWEISSEERGVLRMNADGTFTTAGNVTVCYSLGAITGNRLLKPQTLTLIKGKACVVYGRDNNADQTAREFRCSLTPSSSAFSDSEYSNMTLNAKVLSDLGSTEPAGRLLYFKGGLPT